MLKGVKVKGFRDINRRYSRGPNGKNKMEQGLQRGPKRAPLDLP